jgi:hypothetical protein
MFARSQMQCTARNIILNVRQEVFVGCDSESWRSVFPLNLKGAACVYVGESGEWSCLGFNLTTASDARQMTSGDQNDKPSKQTDPDLSHVKYLLCYDAASSRFGFNKNPRRSVSKEPSELHIVFDHCMIFIFTASTRTPST